MKGEKLKVCLTIAGFDPSGGAGVLADSATFKAFGCWPVAAVTALTVQNSSRFEGYSPVEPGLVRSQVDVILQDFAISAVKIGMIPTADIAEVVAAALKDLDSPVVLDPVLSASAGGDLTDRNAIEVIKDLLFPIATLVTPNIDEAAVLSGMNSVQSKDQILEAASILSGRGCSVLIKGGHLRGESVDLLLETGHTEPKSTWIGSGRVPGRSPRGTGCRHSSAIAANLALGSELVEACKSGRDFLVEMLESYTGPASLGNGVLLEHAGTRLHERTK